MNEHDSETDLHGAKLNQASSVDELITRLPEGIRITIDIGCKGVEGGKIRLDTPMRYPRWEGFESPFTEKLRLNFHPGFAAATTFSKMYFMMP